MPMNDDDGRKSSHEGAVDEADQHERATLPVLCGEGRGRQVDLPVGAGL